MAKEFNTEGKLSPKEMAQHLKKPDGEEGKEIGLMMNKGNKYICLYTYEVLNPQKDDHILEIGMGNGFFVKDLLAMAKNLTYVGVDFSPTMVKEAESLNKDFIDKNVVSFEQASIEKLPFEENTFDKITTTNTLYFWPTPSENIQELLRVLKPGGKLVIGYRAKDLLDQLELTQYGFEKYEIENVEGLLEKGGFKTVNSQIISEPELSFDGKVITMKGIYTFGTK